MEILKLASVLYMLGTIYAGNGAHADSEGALAGAFVVVAFIPLRIFLTIFYYCIPIPMTEEKPHNVANESCLLFPLYPPPFYPQLSCDITESKLLDQGRSPRPFSMDEDDRGALQAYPDGRRNKIKMDHTIIDNEKVASLDSTNLAKHNAYNRKRHNLLALATIHKTSTDNDHGSELLVIVFPIETDLARLCVVVTSMSLPSQDKAETLVLADIPSSSILSTHTFEMGQPILQVSALEGFGSSASGDPWSTVAIAVRTQYTSSLFHVNVTGDPDNLIATTNQVHRFVSFRRNSSLPDFRVAAISLSPYDESVYSILGDNGQILLFEVSRFRRQFKLPSSSWHSLCFGQDGTTLIAASAEYVVAINFKVFLCHLLYKIKSPREPIITVTNLYRRKTFLYWVITSKRILLMDTREPRRPLISTRHWMDDQPPTAGHAQQTDSSIWIFLWNPNSNSIFNMKYPSEISYMSEHTESRIETHISPLISTNYLKVKNDSSSEESIPMLGFSVIPTIASSLDQREPAEKNSALLWLRLLQNGGIYMKSFVEGDGMLREIEQQQMCPLQDCFPLERLRESKYAAFKEQRAEPYRVRLILKLAKAMSEQAAPRVAAKTIPSISALLEQKGPIDVPETLQELLRSCNMENLPHVGLDKIPRANYRIETERWDFRQNVFPSVFSSVGIKNIDLEQQVIKPSLITFYTEPSAGAEKLRYFQGISLGGSLSTATKLLATEWEPGLPENEFVPFPWGEQWEPQAKNTSYFPYHDEKELVKLSTKRLEAMPSKAGIDKKLRFEPATFSCSVKEAAAAAAAGTAAAAAVATADVTSHDPDSLFSAIASQPVPGAFSSRKQEPKKKKAKVKAKGFK